MPRRQRPPKPEPTEEEQLAELRSNVAFLNKTLATLRETGRQVVAALRKAPPFLVAGEDGRLYILGGTRFSRWLLKRRTRREILHPFRLLYRQPVLYGPSAQDMEARQAAGSFNEERQAISANWGQQLDELRLLVARLRVEESREIRAALRPGRLPA